MSMIGDSALASAQLGRKLFVQTYGCQMNVYDSQKMVDILAESHGFVRTEDVNEADMILCNTCSVRDRAEQKLFAKLQEWLAHKRRNPNLIIGVGGCVASQEGEFILEKAPHVDIIFGPQTVHRLPALYEARLKNQQASIDISFPAIEKFDSLPEPRAEGPTAFVSIMEGCSKYCSFCIVPYTRGEEVSRDFDDVLGEVAALADQGVREIVLLGQNVNDYYGTMEGGESADLALLIHYVAAIEGIERIRFTTSHPLAFSDNLIQAFTEVPQLAYHLHLPVQSGSNRILAAMKRGYTVEYYLARIAALRKGCPDIPISSDFIVGFPGETASDFQATLDLVKEVGFDNSFSFIYSPRPGTPAAELADPVPLATKKTVVTRIAKLFARFSC